MPANKPVEVEKIDVEEIVRALEKRILQLREYSKGTEGLSFKAEIEELTEKVNKFKSLYYSQLTSWQRVQIARNLNRPTINDLMNLIFDEFIELHGDKCFADDKAMFCALAKFAGKSVVVIANRKGKTTSERIKCNFGCAYPEGYRKAFLKMKLAEKFHMPVISFIDTPGAYPGIGAEERGQAFIIAHNLSAMAQLRTLMIVVITGEGGSGGALGIGVGDRILMLENAYLSVISPEGCAAILWRDADKAEEAAKRLKLTAHDLKKMGLIDEIIPEPIGGAHTDYMVTAKNIKESLTKVLEELQRYTIDEVLNLRFEKYRKIGMYVESKASV